MKGLDINMVRIDSKFWKRFDFVLFFCVIMLTLYGFIMIRSATMSFSYGSMPFLKKQIIAFVLGLIAVVFLVLIDYEIYGNLYIPIYVLCNLLLLAVLIFGVTKNNAKSWLSINGQVFQPAELAKFGIIISLAKYIDINKDNINEPFTLLKILMFAGLPVALILKQPDFGTAIVFVFFIFVMLFISGLNLKYIFGAIGLGILSIPILLTKFKDFQIDRILVFLNPEIDPSGSGYQVIQSKTAIGSGMVFGRGLFEGVQNQYGFLPEKQTDFIFAVIGEELGLIGGIFLILLYAILMYRLIRISKNSVDLFGSLIVTGITAMMFFHIFENIGMTLGLTPVTGIPLPFISYGGTFQLANMISIGLALSVGIKKEGLEF